MFVVMGLLSCKEPTTINIDNKYEEIEIVQYRIGDVIEVYAHNVTHDIIRSITININGLQTIYTGAFGNITPVYLVKVNISGYICNIEIKQIVFY